MVSSLIKIKEVRVHLRSGRHKKGRDTRPLPNKLISRNEMKTFNYTNEFLQYYLITKRIFAFSAISFGAPKIKDYDNALVKVLYNKSTKDVIVLRKKFKIN